MKTSLVDPYDNVTLLLTYSYFPVNINTARACFHHFYGGRVKAIDLAGNLFSFGEWQEGLKPSGVRKKDAIPVEIDRDNPWMRSAHDKWMLPTRTIATERFHLTQRKRRQNLCKRDYCRIHKYRCQMCYKRFPYEELTLDHIVPKSLGGPNIPENMTLMCRICNNRKGNTYPVKDDLGFPQEGTKVPERYLVVSDSDMRPEWEELIWS